MYIQYATTNELGEEVVVNHPTINLNNVASYAKHNHKKCNGTGIERWDNGWQYYTAEKDGHFYLDRTPINPRILMCDCVLRTLAKTGE